MTLFNTNDPTPSSGPNSGNENVPTTAQRRAAAWLKTRLERGRKERFCEIVKVSPDLAGLMLENNTANRHLSRGTATKYAQIMMEGRWRLTSEALSFDRGGNLTNGQHRLSAIVESGVTVEFTVWFGCISDEFAYVDQGRARTASDLLSIDGLTNYSTRAAAAQLQLRVDTGMTGIFDSGRVRQRAHEMAGPDLDEAISAGERSKSVVNKTAGAWAYWTILRNSTCHGKLPIFWSGLTSGADLSPKSPVLRVREFLRSHKISTRNGRDRATKEAAAIILAWNAYAKGNMPRSFEWPHSGKLPEVF